MPQITPPKKLKQSRVEATVTFTDDEAAKAEAKAVEKLGESIRIEGFRPGRAPAELIRKQINPGDLSEEAIRILLPSVFDTMLKEHKVQPIIPPKVDLTSRTPLTLVLTFVERPEVKVKGVDKIKIGKKETVIEKKDADRMLDYLKNQYRTVTPADRAAKDGDEVTLDFVGTMDGKEAEGTRANGYRLLIGSKTLIPGFEEQVIGMKKAEQKTFTLAFPTDYHAEHLKGKPVAFSVTVQGVEEVNLPEFTDAFVKEHHLGESAQELTKRIEQTLREQEEQTNRTDRERQLFDTIRTATVIDLAPELIAHEERLIFDEVGRTLEQQKLPMDEWLKQTNRTVEAFKKELQDEAAKRLTLRFAIQWILDEKKIEVTAPELAAAVSDMLKNVPDTQGKEAEAYYKEGSDGYDELKWRKRVEKLVEMMLDQ